MFINAELRPNLMGSRNFLPVHIAGSSYHQLNQMAGSAFNASSSFGPAALPASNPPAHDFESAKQGDCSQPFCTPTFASRSTVSSSHDEIWDGSHIETALPRYTYPEAEDDFFFSQSSELRPEELGNCLCFDSLMTPENDENTDEWILGVVAPLPAMHSETQLMDSHYQAQSGCKSPRSNGFAQVSTSPTGRSPSWTHMAFEHMMAHPFLGSFGPSGFSTLQDTPNDLPLESSSRHCTAYVDSWGEMAVNTGLVDSTEPAWSLDYDSQPDQTGDNLPTNSLPSSPVSPQATLYTKISPGAFHTVLPDELPLSHHISSVSESDASKIMVSSGYSQGRSSHDPVTSSLPSGFRSCWGHPPAQVNHPTVQVPPLLECNASQGGIEPPSHNSTMGNGGQGEVLNPQIEQHATRTERPFARRTLKLKLVRKPTSAQLPANWPSANADSLEMDASIPDTKTARCAKPEVAIMQPEDRDDFLIRSRLAGMTYKEIRRLGGFTEAESTLRGRHRSLIKEKHERVRRPIWENKDVRLLREAVRKLTDSSNTSDMKVSWRSVADYIYEHGGSYRFGSATCSRRWNELKMAFHSNSAVRARKHPRSAAISSTR